MTSRLSVAAMKGWRSLLFVAADDKRRISRIAERGADAIILDLEDAIPPERKNAARSGLASVVDCLSQQSCEIVIRINTGWREIFADLSVSVRPGVTAIMIPKVEDASRLQVIAEMIAEHSEAIGLGAPPPIIALIESPVGLAQADKVSRIPTVIGLALGSEDFSLALGVTPSADVLDLPCKLLALAAGQRNLMALGLPISISTMADTQAWEKAIVKARAIGMTGALCIHPRQVPPVTAGFAPSTEDLEHARRVLAAWEVAGASGLAKLDGQMIDRPVAEMAFRTLTAAQDVPHLGDSAGACTRLESRR